MLKKGRTEGKETGEKNVNNIMMMMTENTDLHADHDCTRSFHPNWYFTDLVGCYEWEQGGESEMQEVWEIER